jgi:hypothetical protein
MVNSVFLSPCVGRVYNKAPGPYMAMIRKETEENYWKTKRIGAAPGTKAWKGTFEVREAAESLVLLSQAGSAGDVSELASHPFLLTTTTTKQQHRFNDVVSAKM